MNRPERLREAELETRKDRGSEEETLIRLCYCGFECVGSEVKSRESCSVVPMAGLVSSVSGYLKESVDSIRNIHVRQVLMQVISLGMIVASALMIWKGLMCITGSESPVVVVLSGSMEPGFRRGDILFLHMGNAPVRAGEIVVFHIDGRDIPIVHRVIKVHQDRDTGEVEVLTKGDNNYGDDRLLYAQGQMWLNRQHIMGRAVGFLPYVGWVTIIMTEKPLIKYLLIGALGLLVITSKD